MSVQESIPMISSKVAMYGGSVTTVTSGAVNHVAHKDPEVLLSLLSLTEFLAVAGFIVALGGFAVNWYYKHKHFKLEEKKINAKYSQGNNKYFFKTSEDSNSNE